MSEEAYSLLKYIKFWFKNSSCPQIIPDRSKKSYNTLITYTKIPKWLTWFNDLAVVYVVLGSSLAHANKCTKDLY